MARAMSNLEEIPTKLESAPGFNVVGCDIQMQRHR